ncbi:MAG: shikimate dehydrogenase [Chlorobi bacterium]|nr:shikimate dehydrogenase [Chlorobiota bacterium]
MEKIFGLLGHPLTHSFSEKYFNNFFSLNKMPFIYKNFDLINLNKLMEIIENKSVFGLNITIPYKEKIIDYLNKTDIHVDNIGAVNTVLINRTGNSFTSIGYNTDYYAFQLSLSKLINPAIKYALVLGSGGASKAVVYALNNLNIKSLIVSRNPSQGQIHYSELSKQIIKQYLLIVNTTPLGMYPDINNFPDIPYKYLTKEHTLYDLIYNPEETLFLKHGKSRKTKIKNGLEMLQLQAQLSWKIWNKEEFLF